MIVDIKGIVTGNLGLAMDETFMLDSNILYWLYSGYPISQQDTFKVALYSSFVANLISNGYGLCTSAGNVQEVLNLVEKAEFELYKVRINNKSLPKKAYRQLSTERNNVKLKESSVLTSICGICKIYRLTITEQQIGRYVNIFDKHSYDPIDYFISENAKSNHRTNIITDDKDFRIDPNLQVYTVL